MIERARSLVILALVLSIAAGFLFRGWFASSVLPPPSRMQAETTQSYRYARLFSETGSIPEADTLVMHPEGWTTSENSIFEEYLAGGIHRLIGGDFDSFIRSFCLLFPLFSVFFMYLWMTAAGYSRYSALAGSALYSFMLPAILRARGGSLYRETVALPMLTCLGWLVERTLAEREGDDGRLTPVMAGLVLFLCLAAWKVTAFISFFLFVYLLWRNWRRRDVGYPLRISLAAAQVAASLLLPHMRHDGALLSPSTVTGLFLLLPSIRSFLLPAAATLLGLAASFAGSGASNHVSAVVLAKVRFLFTHPSDPSLLTDDARIFWVPGYTSPSPAQFLLLFGIPVIAALPGIRQFWRQMRGRLIFWFLPLSLAGYLFFDRLMVFLALALLPVIALAMRKRWAALAAAVLILLQTLIPGSLASLITSAGMDFQDSSSLLSDRELDDFLAWVRNSTEPDDAVLSFWHISGLVSAYADRPVVTHTFFENADNRMTIMRFARTMFMPEDSLVAFMRERDSKLLVYQADFLLDSTYSGLLYLAGLRSIPEDAVAPVLQYRPELLDSLEPVFQGPSLRVFALDCIEPPDIPRSFLFQERYRHCYRGYDDARSLTGDMRAWSGYLADQAIETGDPDMLSGALLLGLQGSGPPDVTGMMLNDLIQLYIQGSYGLEGLAEDVNSFIWFNGPDPGLSLLLARLYASEGMLQQARDEYEDILSRDPSNREAASELEMLEREIGLSMEGEN